MNIAQYLEKHDDYEDLEASMEVVDDVTHTFRAVVLVAQDCALVLEIADAH